ncbi:Forkhead transcription factor [Friedmanniomyces endolithicus]|uniref:Forkhead transcription factor n=1 Tax=Friedmanniomyces endolithicus TaxID=329885 RepID=A0AAN6FEX8_9PEZI|nr:Forkhead transcription factor [Friedmanniomyces endolithicus]KAK0286486.1 Forkhead transcription factor [Friedmanniomyces endolithicus]KAK0317215.1 Forkhead transcription factor [Friedmanniomyces endolithicus]KAK0919858.1 Forkhead transcription factor [Friedmanniomyces endolithicus]KAK0971026.1 Forkhead transcription factor [Friedmanniomyces endolithicus]
MHHPDGFSVRLRHSAGYYEEKSEFTRSGGSVYSWESKARITRTLEATEDEYFTLTLALSKKFRWHSASAICVVVRIGIQGQPNRVITFVAFADKLSTRDGELEEEEIIAERCGLLPPPRIYDPVMYRFPRISEMAVSGSVLVFVTRGHEFNAAPQDHSRFDPTSPQYSRVVNGVAVPMTFQPLISTNGISARFEFHVTSKGYSPAKVHAGTAAETAGGRNISVNNPAPSEDQVDGTQEREQPHRRLLAAGNLRPRAHEATKESELGVGNAPVCPLMGNTGGHTVNHPYEDVRSADYVPGFTEANHTVHTQKKRTPEVRDDGVKPQHSYAALIGYAILRSPNCRLTCAQIYRWISENFTFYKMSEPRWQSSVRTHLSTHKSFVRQERPKSDPGKGDYWTIVRGEDRDFLEIPLQRITYPEHATGIAGQSLETYETRPTVMRPESRVTLPPLAAITPRQQSQQAQSLAPTVHEDGDRTELTAPLNPQPPVRPQPTVIDLTRDEKPVVIKQEPRGLNTQEHQVPTVEEEDDEDELQDRMEEVGLKRQEVELRRKMRELKKKKQRRVVATQEG